MADALVQYCRGSHCLADRVTQLCMAEVSFCIIEAHGSRGVPPSSLEVDDLKQTSS